MDRQKANLLIDVGLYVGFILAMLLDLTGLPVHEWLGAAVVVVSAYHLLIHWKWVTAVATKFLKGTSGQARRFFVIDALMMIGFIAIAVTGLIVSTWLELPLANYSYWRDLHVYVSVATLAIVVLKVGLHWRWIVTTGRRAVVGLASSPTSHSTPQTPRGGGSRLGRREFARVMAGIGATAAYAGWAALSPVGGSSAEATVARLASAFPTATPTPAATATAARPTATPSPAATVTTGRRGSGAGQSSRGAAAGRTTGAAPTRTPVSATPTATTQPAGSAPATAPTQPAAPTATATPSAAKQCTVRCPKHCSYPGQCRKYVDANQNRLCDLGECL